MNRAAERAALRSRRAESAFPTRVLNLAPTAALAATSPDPARLNQHVAGLPDGQRVMTAAEVKRLNDPFAKLVLRRGTFPANLSEILEAFDRHDRSRANGLPDTASFLIAEGGQIPFARGVDKGHSRLITVRSRANGDPEVLISTLVPAGVDPRSPEVLHEVQAWDPVNRTMHFYQRQSGAWFWCGQSDMALVAPTRGEGPFDSHVNGYPLMKELQTPWLHWHGPDLAIAESAYAPNDPLLADPLFVRRGFANTLENVVVRPLMQRWNTARFEKAVQGGRLTGVPTFFRQVVESTTANLISTRTLWSRVESGDEDLDDLPPTFFFDHHGLTRIAGLELEVPPLRMRGTRYAELVATYDLRVRGGGVDQAGDVPFAFAVPERAEEDQLATEILVRREVMTPRLAACLLMTDVPNPVDSRRRATLAKYAPASVSLASGAGLDRAFVNAVRRAAPSTGSRSPEREFLANWELGRHAWKSAFEARLHAFVDNVARRLATDAGSDQVFRLAESRRRLFRRRPLAEFSLTIPAAAAIPDDAVPLAMTETGRVVMSR